VNATPRRRPLFWRSAGSAFATVLLLAVLGVALSLTLVPRVMHGAALTVLTGSMEPTYSPGDMVVSVPQDSYAIGDAITFQPVSGDPSLITHRIIAVQNGPEGTGYITRGDANGADDEPIVAAQVMGKVIYSIPYVGHAAQALGSHREILLVVAGAVLVGFGIYAFGSAAIAKRSAASHERAAARTL
jgi:signal peptidase